MRGHLVVLWLLLLLTGIASTTAVLRVLDVQRHQNDALHAVICFSEHRYEVSKRVPEPQRRQAIRAFNQALAVAHLAPCHEEG